jgi:two-component system response regulator RegA
MGRTFPTILVVEDDDVFRGVLTRALSARGYDVMGAPDAATAIARASEDPPEMAIVDLRLPDASGLDVVKALKRIEPATVIVVLTGYGSIATALEAVRLGAAHYLTKPTDADRILAAFERGLLARPRDIDLATPSLARVEWEHLQRVLVDCDGNVSEAARVLGMNRRSLQRKLAKRPSNR